MSRFIVLVLLIVIFFLSGVMYGDIKSTESVEVEEEVKTTIDRKAIEKELSIEEKPVLIQKIASSFETITISMFNVMISLLYSIANSFF